MTFSGGSPLGFSGSSLGTLELQLTANQAALQAQLNQTRTYATQVARDIERQINRAFSGPPRTSSTQLPGLQNASSQGAQAGADAGRSFTDRFMSAIAPIKGAIESIFDGSLQKAGASAFSSVTDVVGSAIDVVKGFGASVFNVTKDFQGFNSSLKTFLKGNQGEIDKFVSQLEKFAATTPFELKDLQKAAIENLAAGAKPEQIIKDLKTIGDVAAGANTDINDLIGTYGRARLAGTIHNDDIQTFQSRGVPLRAELAKSLGASEAEVTQLASDGKIKFQLLEEALQHMTQQGGVYFDGMKNKAETLEGKLSNVGDTFYQFQKQLGQSFEPLFSTVTDFLGQLVSGLTNNKDLMAELKSQTQGLSEYFKQNPEIAENLSNALNELARGAMSALVAAAKQLGGYLKENPRAIQDAVTSGIALGREIGGVVTSTASLVSYMVQFTKGVKDAAIAVRDTLGGAMKSLGIGEKKDNPVANFLTGDVSQSQRNFQDILYGPNASAAMQAIGRALGYKGNQSPQSTSSGGGIINQGRLSVFSGGRSTTDASEVNQHHGNAPGQHAYYSKEFEGKQETFRNDGGQERLVKDIVLTKNGSTENVPVPSAAIGTARVKTTAESGGYGNLVEILNEQNQVIARMAHLQSTSVKTGDQIQFGQTVGIMGDTGHANGVHLHLEVLKELWTTWYKDVLAGGFEATPAVCAICGGTSHTTEEHKAAGNALYGNLASQVEKGKNSLDSSGNVLWGKAANYAPSDLSKLSATGKKALEALKNPNVRAFLDSVAYAENGEIANTTGGYGVLVGSESKDTFDPNKLKTHPGIVGKGTNSTATGRYQTMDFVWNDDTDYGAKGLGLADFKPQSQEVLAVGRMIYRKILDKVMSGDIEGALQRRNSNYDAPSEWASLEGNPYKQGTGGGKRQTFLTNFRKRRNDLQSSSQQSTAIQDGPPSPTANTDLTTQGTKSAAGGSEQDHRNLLTARRKLNEQTYNEIATEYAASHEAQDATIKQQRELDAQRREADDKTKKAQLQLSFADAPDSESKKILERNLQQYEINHKYDEEDTKYQETREDLVKSRDKKEFVLAESKRRQDEVAKTETDPKLRAEKIRVEQAFSAKESGTDYSKGIAQLDKLIAGNKELRKIALETANLTDSTADKQADKAKDRQQTIDELNRSSAQYVDSLKLQESLTTSEPTKQKLEQAIAQEEATHKVKIEILELKNTLDDLNERKTYLLGKGGLKEDSQEIQRLNKEIAESTAKINAAAAQGGIDLKVLENQSKQAQTAMQRTQQIEKQDLDRSTQLSQLNREMYFAKTEQQKAELQAQINKINALGDEQKQLQPLQQSYDDLVIARKKLIDEAHVDSSSGIIKSLDAEIARLNYQLEQVGIQSKNSFDILEKESQKTIGQGGLADREAALSKESGLTSSRTSVLQGQATLIRNRGGNEYQASALDAEASRMQEQIRYKQELLQIEQQIAAVKGKAGEYTETEIATMKANAEALNKINLESISSQVKTLGKDLTDVSKNALGGFFTDIITGSKSAGDAFRDLASNIANQLAQLAVNKLISDIFGGGGGLFGGNKSSGGLGALLGFYQGGIVPNYAIGGSVGAVADALHRERAASGLNPVLAALTPGEMVLTVKQAKRFQELRLDKVLNFANGGVIGSVSSSGEANAGGMTITIPVTVTGQVKETSVDVPRLQSSIRGVVVEELLKQQRPGGALNR